MLSSLSLDVFMNKFYLTANCLFMQSAVSIKYNVDCKLLYGIFLKHSPVAFINIILFTNYLLMQGNFSSTSNCLFKQSLSVIYKMQFYLPANCFRGIFLITGRQDWAHGTELCLLVTHNYSWVVC